MRGEWIEISVHGDCERYKNGSLPMRGEWIEIPSTVMLPQDIKASLPMRGEWIEICVGGVLRSGA